MMNKTVNKKYYFKSKLIKSFIIILFVSVALLVNLFHFYLTPFSKNMIKNDLVKSGYYISFLLQESGIIKAKNITSLFNNKIIRRSFLSPDHVSVLDANLIKVFNYGHKKNLLIMKEQYNESCGINAVLRTLTYCYNHVNDLKITNVYFPIIEHDKLKGIIYLEVDNDKLMTNLNLIVGVFILVFMLIIAFLMWSFYKYIIRVNENVYLSFSAISNLDSINDLSSLPKWMKEETLVLKNNHQVLEKDNIEKKEFIDNQAIKISTLTTKLTVLESSTEETLSNISEKLAQASHDIRSPLHTILGTSELLLQHIESTDKLKVLSIFEAAKDLKDEVDNILVYETNKSHNIAISLHEFDLEKEIDQVVQQMGIQYSSESPVEVFSSISPKVPKFILSYKVALMKIINNLGTNARKYTQSGFVLIKVDFQKRTETNGKLIITIQDTGIGISEKILDAFNNDTVQFHQHENGQGGIGLGYKIIKDYQKQINATINVSTKLNEGTKFIITLDINISEQSHVKRAEDKSCYLFSKNNLKFLALKNKLVRHGYHVVCKNNLESLVDLEIIENRDVFFCIDSKDDIACCKEMVEKYKYYNRLVVFTYFKHEFEDVKQNNIIISEIHTPLSQILQINDKSSNEDLPVIDYSHLKILSVDNEKQNLKLIEYFLQKTGVSIVSCLNPVEAIELCKVTTFDLILMDIFMPELPGYEASRQIKQLALNKNTPIIAATATVSSNEKKRIFECGMNDIIIKPFDSKNLLLIIKKNLFLEENSNEKDVLYNHINKMILGIQGGGDLRSNLIKLCDIEDLMMLLSYLEYDGRRELQDLFVKLKEAYYYKNQPVEKIFKEISCFLIDLKLPIR